MSSLDINTTLNYSGPYSTLDGQNHVADNMLLTYIEFDANERFPQGWINAAQHNKLDGEENLVTIDAADWASAVCEQTGGHSFTIYPLSEEPGDAIEVCSRCGNER